MTGTSQQLGYARKLARLCFKESICLFVVGSISKAKVYFSNFKKRTIHLNFELIQC